MDYFLGIDGGGTSTRALLCGADGTVLGRGESGLSNVQHTTPEAFAESLDAAVSDAFARAGRPRRPAGAAFLGIAGIVGREEREAVLQTAAYLELAPAGAIGVDHDIRIALSGSHAGEPGIALIAGTGSSCYGRNAAGETAQVGGWGFLADDAGSAGWLARRALGIAVRQADGRLADGSIRRTVFSFLEITDSSELLRSLKARARHELARLAPALLELADAGDQQASGLIDEAVDKLVELVAVCARRLNLYPARVAATGGLARAPSFLKRIERTLHDCVPGAALTDPRLSPVAGAALEALRLGGISPNSEHIRNLA